MEFEFERRRVTKEEIGELIFREILEYHPQLLKDYINGTERTNFLYPRFLLFVFRSFFNWLSFFSLIYIYIFHVLPYYSSHYLNWSLFFTVLLINSRSNLLILRKLVAKVVQFCHLKESMYHFPGNSLMY